jgi:hypothetical protein
MQAHQRAARFRATSARRLLVKPAFLEGRKMRCLTAATALLLLAGQAYGQSIESCRKIQENAARLTCYDKLPVPAAQPKWSKFGNAITSIQNDSDFP